MVSDEGSVLLAVCLQHCYFACWVLDIFSDAGAEETTIPVYWVTNVIDCCHVGFLLRHLVPRAHLFYSECLVQVVEMLADSENPRQMQYSCHNLGACKAVMIDTTLVDDNVTANRLCGCCMDAFARHVMQEEETKNDDENLCLLRRRKEE